MSSVNIETVDGRERENPANSGGDQEVVLVGAERGGATVTSAEIQIPRGLYSIKYSVKYCEEKYSPSDQEGPSSGESKSASAAAQ